MPQIPFLAALGYKIGGGGDSVLNEIETRFKKQGRLLSTRRSKSMTKKTGVFLPRNQLGKQERIASKKTNAD